MKTADFAQSIRDKYPEGISSSGVPYSEMDDQELVNKVVEKYPVYKEQLEDFTPTAGPIGSPIEAVKEFGKDVVGAVKERGGNIVDDMIANTPEEQEQIIKGGLGRAALRFGGQIGGLVGDLELSALKLVAPKFVEDLTSKGLEKISKTELAQTVATKIDDFKAAHPEAAQDVEDVVNIAALIPYVKGAQVAVEGVQKTGQAVSKVTGAALDANRAARITNATKEIDSVVGNIIQGKKSDILKAKKALSTIDTSDVKTYGDLSTKIDDGIEALATKVDDLLDKEGAVLGPLKKLELETKTKVGEKVVSQNFVEDALNQLDELYTNIKDAPAQARIVELKNKLETEGLTLREINDLSRTYGIEFKNKAFGKTGEALTSTNAQAFENTRMGIKDVSRKFMPDETTKMLDERMSEMFNTSALVKKMEEKVNALYQKAKKRGVLEKVARGAADVVNMATFNTLSGFVSRLLPSNVGLKVMNSIDLENMLGKNLKKLNKLVKVTDDKVLEDGIIDFVKNGVDNIKPSKKSK